MTLAKRGRHHRLLTHWKHIEIGDTVEINWPCLYRATVVDINKSGFRLRKANGFEWTATRSFLSGKIEAIFQAEVKDAP